MLYSQDSMEVTMTAEHYDNPVQHYSYRNITGNPEEWGYKGPGWYWWDEEAMYAYGPYSSEESAQEAMERGTK